MTPAASPITTNLALTAKVMRSEDDSYVTLISYMCDVMSVNSPVDIRLRAKYPYQIHSETTNQKTNNTASQTRH